MVEIRNYKDSDYEDVKTNLKEGDLYDEVWDSRENLKKKIERDPDSIIVAVEDGKAIGNIYVIRDGWANFVFRLAVRKTHRNKGIAKVLMKEAETRLKQIGVKECSLFVRDDDNKLKEWYKKQGYQASKRKHQAMWKEL